jgi:hypothetical protein
MPPARSERSANARRAALTRSANEIGADISQPARDAFLESFVPPPREGVSDAERERQAKAALKLHMAELGRLSGRARRRATEAAEDAARVEELAEALADETL